MAESLFFHAFGDNYLSNNIQYIKLTILIVH